MFASREPAGSEANALSFDRAEWANDAPGGPYCRRCGGPIRDEYDDVVLVALIYAVPVFVGMNHPISALIFACGLWQAWIMTRGREMSVTGPYRIRASGRV